MSRRVSRVSRNSRSRSSKRSSRGAGQLVVDQRWSGNVTTLKCSVLGSRGSARSKLKRRSRRSDKKRRSRGRLGRKNWWTNIALREGSKN